MTKFEKTHTQRCGIPFWDHSFDASLMIRDDDGKRIWCIGAFDLAELKKLLNNDFDGRIGRWKRKEKQKTVAN